MWRRTSARILNHSGTGTMSAIARIYNVHTYQDEMRQALEGWGRDVGRILGQHEATIIRLRG